MRVSCFMWNCSAISINFLPYFEIFVHENFMQRSLNVMRHKKWINLINKKYRFINFVYQMLASLKINSHNSCWYSWWERSVGSTCRNWFRCFEKNIFHLASKESSGTPTKFVDEEFVALLSQDRCQRLVMLGKILCIFSKRLKALGMIQKQWHWVLYKLSCVNCWFNGRKKVFSTVLLLRRKIGLTTTIRSF